MSGSTFNQLFDPSVVGAPQNQLAPPPTWADAWQFNAQAAQAELERQRAISEQRGEWDSSTGLPTKKALLNAAHQYAQGLLFGTTAPGARGVPLDNPAFAKWFGNSKAVDEAGQPLVVYKGMHPYDWTKETPRLGGAPPTFEGRGPEIESIDRTTPFPTFDRTDPEGVKIAGFFSDNPRVASRFAEGGGTEGAVYPVHLSFQNPHIIDAAGEKAGNIQFGATGRDFRDAIRSGKHDSVIIRNTADEGNIYIALRPEQIKSAIGNRGTFDPRDPRINYGLAGLTAGGAGAAATQGQDNGS